MVSESKSNAAKGTAPSTVTGAFVPLLIVALAVGIQKLQSLGHLDALLSQPPAATKPYGDFESFYPFYLKEHSDPNTKRTHFIGTAIFAVVCMHAPCPCHVWYRFLMPWSLQLVLRTPKLILPLLSAASIGYVLFPFFRHLASGLLEMAILLSVYFFAGYSATRSAVATILPPVVAYSFAWFGHFYFEHNKPATFIYPIFSLFGDFRMLYDLLTGKIPF